MHWYKRDPNAAIVGMSPLTMDERGAYNGILDLLYASDGNVPANDVAIAKQLTVQTRTWVRLRKGLEAKGKVWESDGRICAKRVEKELNTARILSEKQRETVGKRWEKERKANKNNGPSIPAGITSTSTSTSTSREERGAPRKEKRTAKAERKRGPRAPMPDDWRPSEVGEQYATAAGFAKERIERMVRKCRDYHIRNSTMIAGDRGLAATWRTWVDHEVDFDREKNGTPVDLEPDYKQITKGMTPEEKKAFVQEEMRKFREANHVG